MNSRRSVCYCTDLQGAAYAGAVWRSAFARAEAAARECIGFREQCAARRITAVFEACGGTGVHEGVLTEELTAAVLDAHRGFDAPPANQTILGSRCREPTWPLLALTPQGPLQAPRNAAIAYPWHQLARLPREPANSRSLSGSLTRAAR